jgi:hypothetical protein
MTKSLIIEFNEQDENRLLSFFKELKVKIKTLDETSIERAWVQNELKKKYVHSGEWAAMDDENRQDAVLAEMMLFERQSPDYGVLNERETKNFLAKIKNGKS